MATDETLTPERAARVLRELATLYEHAERHAALIDGADALETNDALARDLAAAREECAAREADRVAAKNETTRLRESVAQLEAHWSTAGKFYDEVLADLRLDAEVAAREAGRAFDRERAALMAQITKLHGKLAGLRTRGAVEAVVAAQVKPAGVNPAEEIERVKDERDHALAGRDAAEARALEAERCATEARATAGTMAHEAERLRAECPPDDAERDAFRHRILIDRDRDWRGALEQVYGALKVADNSGPQAIILAVTAASAALRDQHSGDVSRIAYLEIVERANRKMIDDLMIERDAAIAAAECLRGVQATLPPPVDCAACTKRHIERVRLPDNREGRTFKLRIGSDEKLCETCGAPLPGSRVSAHLTINRYADGRPGEVFLALDRARRGDLAATFGHQLAVAISIGLQYGVPADVFASRMRHVRDESGGTVMREVDGRRVPAENPRTVGSLVDLIAVTLGRFAATDDVSDPDTAQGG